MRVVRKKKGVSISKNSRQRTSILAALAGTFLSFLAAFLALFGAFTFLTTFLAAFTLRMAAVSVI